METLETLIRISGVIHLGTLLASAQLPRELRFREELPRLSPLLRQWTLTAGGYIVLNLIALGAISLACADELASGTRLARWFCAYVAVFWLIRLAIALFVFDARPYLRNALLAVGYHALTAVFVWHTLIYGAAALLTLP
jgi:hypothetical protein